jgi:hypothetical protein
MIGGIWDCLPCPLLHAEDRGWTDPACGARCACTCLDHSAGEGAEMMAENKKKKTTYSSNCFFSLSSASRFSSFFGFGFLAAVGAGESACVDTFRQSNHALDEISAGSVPV